MKQAFIAERDRQYKVTLDIEKPENRYQYLLSDNPACAGRFLREDYKPAPHDDSNIRRCKKEANDIQDKLNAVVTKLEKHDNSPFTDNGKLKTGLSCLHNFNAEQRHSIKSQVGLNVLHLVEDLDRVMAKYKATFPIGAKSKASKSRKKKEQKKKREKKRIAASESRRTRTCIIFRSLGGEPIDDNYETEVCGIPQLETVDLETLSLFKSRTDLACLRDLLNAKCFIGKAHNVVCDFCA